MPKCSGAVADIGKTSKAALAPSRSNARRGIKPPPKAAHGFGRRRIPEKIGNRFAEFMITHWSGRTSQRANSETADDLIVMKILLPGNQSSNSGQQRGNRQFESSLALVGECWQASAN
jgi:hypothetical protein